MARAADAERGARPVSGAGRGTGIASDRFPPDPVAAERVARRGGLPSVGPPPDAVVLDHGLVRLPPGSEASLIRVEGAEEVYRLRVERPGAGLGVRVAPPSVPVTLPSGGSAARARTANGADSGGWRPPHLPQAFVPEDARGGAGAAEPGGDERIGFDDTTFPWCTVGRVDTPGSWCTGCTIGPRLLLTCAHAIAWNGDGTAGWVRFRPAYANGTAPFGEAWATEVIAWTLPDRDEGLSDRETAFDYAVCVLDHPIGELIGYPGYRTYRHRWNGRAFWQHAGYPIDLCGGERPVFQGAVVVSSVGGQRAAGQTGYVLGHFNATGLGHSGGPVWGWWGEEPWPRVVGTQSGRAYGPEPTAADDHEMGGGPALSALIAWARAHRP